MGNAYLTPIVGQLIVALAVGLLLLFIYWWVRAQSPLVANLLAIGLLLRATAGLLLFWLSYLDVAWLSQFHSGDGFWRFAPADAPSAYSHALSLWMRAVGATPASGFFLNLLLYALLGALLALVFRVNGDWRNDAPCLLTLGAFTFSPLLLIHGTQPLKDHLFACLIGVASVAALMLIVSIARGMGTLRHARGSVIGLLVLLPAAYAMASLHAWFAFLFGGCLAVALGVLAFRQGGGRVARWLPPVAATLLVWLACYAGAGASPFKAPAGLLDAGSTRGPAVLFVPLSLLRSFELVELDAGRGMLVISDLDTVFLDLTVLAVVVLLFQQRPLARRNLPYVLLLVALSLVTAAVMAYAVTDLGSLVRLRLMLTVPLWMLPLALSGHPLLGGAADTQHPGSSTRPPRERESRKAARRRRDPDRFVISADWYR